MGHKHADEMSVALWAGGTLWWSNVGYWPYDSAERGLAESWEGSNAPHRIDENTDGRRETKLRYSGRSTDLALVDMERRGPDTYSARRQVVQVGPDLWFVIDTSSDEKKSRTRTLWTTSPDVSMTERGHGEFALIDRKSSKSMRAFFAGAPDMHQSVLEGSTAPFGGWLVMRGDVRSAPALLLERPADGGWQLAAWRLEHPRAGPDGAPSMLRWKDAEHWEVSMPAGGKTLMLSRQGTQLNVAYPDGRSAQLPLDAGPDVSQSIAALRAALQSSQAKYRAQDMSGGYRIKVSVVLLVLLLVGGIMLAMVRRFSLRLSPYATIAVAAGWLLVAGYFMLVRAQLI
jgi:hypothetical protein